MIHLIVYYLLYQNAYILYQNTYLLYYSGTLDRYQIFISFFLVFRILAIFCINRKVYAKELNILIYNILY